MVARLEEHEVDAINGAAFAAPAPLLAPASSPGGKYVASMDTVLERAGVKGYLLIRGVEKEEDKGIESLDAAEVSQLRHVMLTSKR